MAIEIFEDLPQNRVSQIRRFARDIAYLYLNEKIELLGVNALSDKLMNNNPSEFQTYLEKVWHNKHPTMHAMRTMGYLEVVNSEEEYMIDSHLMTEVPKIIKEYYGVTQKAISLLEEPLTAKIFISYSRAESSTLALLIVARLKEHGLSAFLDMHPDREGLAVGDEWHAKLEDVIASNDSFIVLIGPNTLNSPYVRQEIEWAYKYKKKIYPVWHNNFRGFGKEKPSFEITVAIQYVMGTVNATIVEAENPKQYNAALDELLSSFGIVP